MGVSPSPDLTIPSPPMILSFTLCQKPVTHTTTPPHHPTAPCPFIPAIVKPCVACLQSFLMIFDSRMISRSGCRSISVSVQWIFAQSRFPGHRFACLFGLALGIALVHLVAPRASALTSQRQCRNLVGNEPVTFASKEVDGFVSPCPLLWGRLEATSRGSTSYPS